MKKTLLLLSFLCGVLFTSTSTMAYDPLGDYYGGIVMVPTTISGFEDAYLSDWEEYSASTAAQVPLTLSSANGKANAFGLNLGYKAKTIPLLFDVNFAFNKGFYFDGTMGAYWTAFKHKGFTFDFMPKAGFTILSYDLGTISTADLRSSSGGFSYINLSDYGYGRIYGGAPVNLQVVTYSLKATAKASYKFSPKWGIALEGGYQFAESTSGEISIGTGSDNSESTTIPLSARAIVDNLDSSTHKEMSPKVSASGPVIVFSIQYTN